MFVIDILVSRMYIRWCRFVNTLESTENSFAVAATVRVRTHFRCVAWRLEGSRCMAGMLFEPQKLYTGTPTNAPPPLHAPATLQTSK